MAPVHTLINASLGSLNFNWNVKTPKPRFLPWNPSLCTVRCSASEKEDHAISSESKESVKRWDGEGLTKMAVAAIAAGVLIVGSAGDAMATKSGGRVGGQAFRSSSPPKSAPRSSGPRINNSRTNVFINPPVAPPIFGGYGFGTPFFGGWGWSPFSFFSAGPTIGIGIGGGFEFFGLLLVLGFVGRIVRNLLRRDDSDDYYD